MLFAQEGALVVQRLNLDTFELMGDPITVARQVAVDVLNRLPVQLATGLKGRNGNSRGSTAPGKRVATLGGSDLSLGVAFRLAPSGRTIVLSRTTDGNQDLWLIDTARATLRRFTTDAAADADPVWSPNADRIVFSSDRRAGNLDVYEKRADGAEPERLLLETSQDKNALDWSPDGRFILYASNDQETRRDLWVLPLFRDRKPLPIGSARPSSSGTRPTNDKESLCLASLWPVSGVRLKPDTTYVIVRRREYL